MTARRPLTIVALFGAAISSLPAALTFREGVIVPDEDRPVVEAFIGHADTFARSRTPENVLAACRKSPESFAWVDFRHLGCLLTAYELTGDPSYLDLFRDTFTLYRGIMSTGDDAFLGWYGAPIPPRRPKDKPDAVADEIQTSFRAMAILGRWMELAQADPAYARQNASTLAAYRDLIENHLFPKWDRRGYFIALEGGRGVYRGFEYPLPKGTSLSHEKLAIVVDGLLAFYRATGTEAALRRALEIGAWYKSSLTLRDGHYEWMSWRPAGSWDVSTEKDDAWKVSWIAPDPNGEWYVAALSIALNLYQMGLLFSDTDLERFVRTQKEMCWNGSLENPEYRTVAGATGKYIKGRFLSHQVSHYDPVLRQLAFSGIHAQEARANVSSSWKGGVIAQDYLREKFLRAPLIAADRQPDKGHAAAFLSRPENREFLERISFEVQDPGAVIPLKPSEADFTPSPESPRTAPGGN